MGAQPVITAVPQPDTADSSSWKLAPGIASDVQGIVVSGYGDLTKARALFLDCAKAPGGAWLNALRAVAPITAADGPRQPAAMIAFTITGLRALGVPNEALESFLSPFQEGMLQADRRRRLGDDDATGQNTISAGGLAWSANTPDQGQRTTPLTVHALLVLYDASDEALKSDADKVADVLRQADVEIVRLMELDLRVDERGIAREHFGFSDGVSQPIPFDAAAVVGPGAEALPCDPIHGVALGDFLLGYDNAHGEIPPGPVVSHRVVVDATILAEKDGPRKDPDAAANPLKAIEGTAGLHDLGLNGSYLVVRELKQDVAAFWNSLDRESARLNGQAGNVDPAVSAEWLAERVVGRNKDGHLLGPKGPWPPLAEDLPDNAPLFFKTDRYGFGCPVGSHVRRANPRDGLANTDSACPNLLDAANAHRILRRGRKFGDTAADDRAPDGTDRGLLFMCLNTDIVRQFEFVQQNWLLNPNFATLYKEVDPLIGPKGKMTVPKEPLRRMVDIETYVTLTGGDYFFLPSLRALDYFETLDRLDPGVGATR